MALTVDEKKQLIKEFGKNEHDTGAVEVQIAMISKDVQKLQSHFSTHRKDNHSRRGLLQKIARRRKLLSFLAKQDNASYLAILEKLNIRHKTTQPKYG